MTQLLNIWPSVKYKKTDSFVSVKIIKLLVQPARFELAQLSPLPPQSSVSTNSTMVAYKDDIILTFIF